MKTFSRILRYVASSLVGIVALVFAILETTLLVTLDFVLYENQFVALIQLVLRLLIALSAMALGVVSLVKAKRSFLSQSLCLLVATAVMIPFVSNNIAIYFTAVSGLFALSQFLSFKTQN